MTILEGYPLEICQVDEDTNRKLRELEPYCMMTGALTIGPDRFFYPNVPAVRFRNMFNYPVDPSDIWLMSLPKCGSNWVQEMIWLIANDCDFEGARKQLIPDRCRMIDWSHGTLISDRGFASVMFNIAWSQPRLAPSIMWNWLKAMLYPRQLPPRFVKTHLSLTMCPPRLLDTCKVVYVARNPKDVLVSYFYHYKLFVVHSFKGTFEQFFDRFLEGKLLQLPFFPHVKQAWELRHHPNLLFIFYEDMKANLTMVIDRVAKFLGKSLDCSQVEKLCNHLHFDSMKNNEFVNAEHLKDKGFFYKTGEFVRKGKTGDWKTHFTDEMSAKMDDWIEQNLKDCSLKFTTELTKQD